MNDYLEFLEKKSQLGGAFGFSPSFVPDFLFDYQKHLLEWSLQKGRAAIYADTGLGKTAMQLAWAQNVVEHTNKNVLILTPLAVSHQTVEEGAKFGIEVKRSRNGRPAAKITVTNYEQLDKFNPNDFIGVACDESSILKNFEGSTKTAIIRFMGKLPYRSLWTATPSPNDFTELGNSSEALGELGYLEMIGRFFRDTQNDKNPAWSTPKYVLKKHAVEDFWRWVASWARAIKKPSDLGFPNDAYFLPELMEREHVLYCTEPLPGEMFTRKARTLNDQRKERRLTLVQRCEKAAELATPYDTSVLWCHLNPEGDLLEELVPNAIQISGTDSEDLKEEKFIAFAKGEAKKLIIKPKIGAWGLNWQFCNHMTYFPSHSYEQYYQSVRRCYRYGQKRDVHVDIITTEGEMGVYQNIRRKSNEAAEMFAKLVKHMNNELIVNKHEYEESRLTLPKFI